MSHPYINVELLYYGCENMNGDGINCDQSDVDNERAFAKLRRSLAKARREFFNEGKRNHKYYGSSEMKDE